MIILLYFLCFYRPIANWPKSTILTRTLMLETRYDACHGKSSNSIVSSRISSSSSAAQQLGPRVDVKLSLLWSHSPTLWASTQGTDQSTEHETRFSLERSALVFDLRCSMTYFLRFWQNVSQETRLSFIISYLFYFYFTLLRRGSSKTKPAAPFCCDLLYCLYSVSGCLIVLFLPHFSSLKRSVLPMRCWQTQKRRSFTIAMENRGCGREEVEGLAWTISSPTFLAEDCLGSWGDKVEDEMEARGEEMTWCTLSSKLHKSSSGASVVCLNIKCRC